MNTIKKIRSRLVWGYTLIIVAIMVVAAIISIWTLSHFVLHSYGESLLSLLKIEKEEAFFHLKTVHDGEEHAPADIFNADDAESVMVLEYWFDSNGQPVMVEGVQSVTRFLEKSIPDWKYANREAATLEFIADNGESWHTLIMADDVYDEDIYLGKVVVGINITPMVGIIEDILMVLAIIAIVVFVTAWLAGNYFAEKAVRPIEQAMQAQHEFVANASHELRTPLSILLASVDMIDSKNSETVKDMKDEILYMRELINSLLMLTQAKDENYKNFADFDMEELLQVALKAMQAIAAAKNIKIMPEAEGLGTFCGDRLKIQLLLSILLDNAIKYSPEGSIIHLKIKQKGHIVEIQVADSGAGISPKDLPHVFERFYRSDNARAESEGFGLGLSIASLIVELHNGTIKIDSSTSTGTKATSSLKSAL